MGKSAYLLLTLLVLIFLGTWAEGPYAWGFNHFAYLPPLFLLVWLALVSVSLLPGVQRIIGQSFEQQFPHMVFNTKTGPWILTLLGGLSFYFLQGQSFFLGDGYLIINLVEKGTPFRIFDNMDFFLHSKIFQQVTPQTDAATLYRSGSILGGVLAIPLLVFLLRRLQWELWRRALVLALFVFSGPVILFFGYIESYTYLYIFITCFLVSGLLYLENNAPLYLVSSFFGLAVFFHFSALFCLPALLFLWLIKPNQKNWKSLLMTILPPVVLVGISLAAHVHGGYSARWLQHDFFDNHHVRTMWLSLTGEYGLFSLANLINQGNLLIVVAPVSMLIIVLRVKNIFARRGESRLQFLIVHLITIGLISLTIDRKLGAARDWDLLVAHSASLYLLAAMVLSASKKVPRKILSLVITTSFLCTAPWIVLEHSEIFSMNRFTDVAKGFPPSARAHAFEELGQHYREQGDLEKSLQMYDQCIAADPFHYRYYALRGATNFSLARNAAPNSSERQEYTAEALKNFSESLERNPSDLSARKNLGKLLILNGNPDEARTHFMEVFSSTPNDPEALEMLVYCLISIMEKDLAENRQTPRSLYSESSILVQRLLEISPGNRKYKTMKERIEAIGLSFSP